MNFHCSQMMIFEWRWKTSHTVSDGLTNDCDASYKTSSSFSNLLAVNSISESAKSITTVSHWSEFHWSCFSFSWKTSFWRRIKLKNLMLKMWQMHERERKICSRRRMLRTLNAWLWEGNIEIFKLHDERIVFDPWWTIISKKDFDTVER